LLSPVATGASWTTPAVTQADTFWYGAWNGNCEGALASITLQALPLPVVSPITGAMSTVNGQTYTYSSVPVGGVVYSWVVTNGTGSSNSDTIAITWGNPGTGSIVLTVTDTAGCSSSTVLNVTVQTVNAAAGGLGAPRLVIAPNPSSGVLSFQVVGGLRGAARKLRITDGTGVVVYQAWLPAGQGDLYRGSFPMLASGVYFVSLEGEDGYLSGVWCVER
jgi:hypothetical protein